MNWHDFSAVLRDMTAWEWVVMLGGFVIAAVLLSLFISVGLDIRDHRRIERMARELRSAGRKVASEASVVCVHGLAFSEPCAQCAAAMEDGNDSGGGANYQSGEGRAPSAAESGEWLQILWGESKSELYETGPRGELELHFGEIGTADFVHWIELMAKKQEPGEIPVGNFDLGSVMRVFEEWVKAPACLDSIAALREQPTERPI